LASAKEIPPGGEGKIEVVYKTGTKFGKKTQRISVHSNDPDQKVMHVKVVMNIKAILGIKPSRISFGKLRRGTQYPEEYALLIGTEKDNAQILSATSKNKDIKVETGVFKTEDDIEKRVKVTILPELNIGRFSVRIIIKTDHEKIKDLKLNIRGEITGNIILNPSLISFGSFRRGGKYERTIYLKAAPGITFKVLDVQSSIPCLHTKVLTLKEGISYKIKAYVEEDFSEDSLDGKIIITTDDETQAIIEVGVFGKVFNVKKLEKKPHGAAGKK